MGDVKPLLYVIGILLLLGLILNLTLTPFIDDGIEVGVYGSEQLTSLEILIGTKSQPLQYNESISTFDGLTMFFNDWFFSIPPSIAEVVVPRILPQSIIDFLATQVLIIQVIPNQILIPLVILSTIVFIWAIREFVGFT